MKVLAQMLACYSGVSIVRLVFPTTFADNLVSAATNILSDLMIVLLPLKWLYRIQRPLPEKLLIISIFSISIFGCIVGVIRLPALLTFLSGLPDFTWNIFSVGIWSVIECAAAIFCGSAPALKPLFFKSKFSRTLEGEIELSKGFYDLKRPRADQWHNSDDNDNL